jgi:hypothetical protein
VFLSGAPLLVSLKTSYFDASSILIHDGITFSQVTTVDRRSNVASRFYECRLHDADLVSSDGTLTCMEIPMTFFVDYSSSFCAGV